MEMSYDIIILGVHIDWPDQIMGDNENVVTSCYITPGTLKKNHDAISYNRVKEYVATGVISLAHMTEKSNLDNLPT